MPPEQGMYLLHKGDSGQKNRFSFTDFFHFDSMAVEHAGVEIISFEEFLKREVMDGQMKDKEGNVAFPPYNRTNWNGVDKKEVNDLDKWVRTFATNPIWAFDECMAAFPAKVGDAGPNRMKNWLQEVKKTKFEKRKLEFFGHPVHVCLSVKMFLEYSMALMPTFLRIRKRLIYVGAHSILAIKQDIFPDQLFIMLEEQLYNKEILKKRI